MVVVDDDDVDSPGLQCNGLLHPACLVPHDDFIQQRRDGDDDDQIHHQAVTNMMSNGYTN